jgi:hypothetical protein
MQQDESIRKMIKQIDEELDMLRYDETARALCNYLSFIKAMMVYQTHLIDKEVRHHVNHTIINYFTFEQDNVFLIDSMKWLKEKGFVGIPAMKDIFEE